MSAPASRGLRICLVCEVLHPPLDEGIRIYAARLARELEAWGEVSLVSSREATVDGRPVHGLLTNRYFVSRPLARHLAGFDPDVLVYVPWTSLTARTLLRVGVLRRYAGRARVGVVALQPRAADFLTRSMARLGRPDRVLAGGPGAERQALSLGLAAARVGAGVDLERFRPADAGQRAELRRRGGIDPEAFVVLHVGHMKGSRNVGIFERLARLPGVRALLVASTSTAADRDLAERLLAAGVVIMARHEDRIERVYQLADAYIFPVRSDLDAMEMPLSVLEAAACDLPIVSTRFGALPGLLEGAAGVRWVEEDGDFETAVRSLAASPRGGAGMPRVPAGTPRVPAGTRRVPAGTRQAVAGRGWRQAAAEVMSALAPPAGEAAR